MAPLSQKRGPSNDIGVQFKWTGAQLINFDPAIFYYISSIPIENGGFFSLCLLEIQVVT